MSQTALKENADEVEIFASNPVDLLACVAEGIFRRALATAKIPSRFMGMGREYVELLLSYMEEFQLNKADLIASLNLETHQGIFLLALHARCHNILRRRKSPQAQWAFSADLHTHLLVAVRNSAITLPPKGRD